MASIATCCSPVSSVHSPISPRSLANQNLFLIFSLFLIGWVCCSLRFSVVAEVALGGIRVRLVLCFSPVSSVHSSMSPPCSLTNFNIFLVSYWLSLLLSPVLSCGWSSSRRYKSAASVMLLSSGLCVLSNVSSLLSDQSESVFNLFLVSYWLSLLLSLVLSCGWSSSRRYKSAASVMLLSSVLCALSNVSSLLSDQSESVINLFLVSYWLSLLLSPVLNCCWSSSMRYKSAASVTLAPI